MLNQKDFDKNHIWHPYSSMQNPPEMYKVVSASGVRLTLDTGEKIIDAMSSWWAAIHGYGVEELNTAAQRQLKKMSHVMFGGLTHDPAIHLARTLLEITRDPLEKVFFSDSGSVAVEVAIKMALQYHHSRGDKQKTKLISFSKAYHGDTFGAMSVCDPHTGMHSLFADVLPKHIFAPEPPLSADADCDMAYVDIIRRIIEENHQQVAAFILEPVVQGAGGMRIYSPKYLPIIKELCERHNILLIFDEIATGFGRTGKLFAYEHADVVPDILCIGKALTGGYMSLAATITSSKVVCGVEAGGNVLMHGPTFMANPLACAIAHTSIELLQHMDWQTKVMGIEAQLRQELERCRELELVKDVRVLGAIGVVELHQNVDLQWMTPAFIQEGVWVRPFLNLVYIMPPFIITPEDLSQVTYALYKVVLKYQNKLLS